MKYAEKFKDPKWQNTRLRILERDKFRCFQCFNKEKTLHIHHRVYKPNADPWDYNDKALITLCEDCHETEKAKMVESLKYLNRTVKLYFLADEVKQLSNTIHAQQEHFCLKDSEVFHANANEL